MILCITPNLAIDRTLVIPGFKTNGVFRPERQIVAAGGKGINAARAVKILGGQAKCGGFVAGYTGDVLGALAHQEGLDGTWTRLAQGETRSCQIIVDPTLGEATVINEQGPKVTSDDWRRLIADSLAQSAGADQVCISGSLPPGSPSNALPDLIVRLAENGKSVWIDTSGAALRDALATGRCNLKVNQDEAGVLLNCEIDGVSAARSAADALHKQGVPIIIITLGKVGAVMVNASGVWYANPPPIKVMSAVGSGDVFLGSLVISPVIGSPDALRGAVAASAANALTIGGGLFDLSDFSAILKKTSLEGMEPG
jgi:1-phosphofructokinase family hexose kinase